MNGSRPGSSSTNLTLHATRSPLKSSIVGLSLLQVRRNSSQAANAPWHAPGLHRSLARCRLKRPGVDRQAAYFCCFHLGSQVTLALGGGPTNRERQFER